jgi:hypothetical protein
LYFKKKWDGGANDLLGQSAPAERELRGTKTTVWTSGEKTDIGTSVHKVYVSEFPRAIEALREKTFSLTRLAILPVKALIRETCLHRFFATASAEWAHSTVEHVTPPSLEISLRA